MSAEQSIDPEAIEQTKRQIRGLVDEINTLAKQNLSAGEYYAEFLRRVVEALAAVGGAVWIRGEGGQFQLAYQINLRKASLDEEGEHQQRHAWLLTQVVQSGDGMLVPPHSGGSDDYEGANPTEMLLVLAPLRSDQQVEGVVEIFQRPTAQPATRRGYLRFLLQMCDLAGDWLKSQKLKQLGFRESQWAQVDQFARAVHETLDLRTTAYTVANEAQRLIGCDRVSVAMQRGTKCKVEAVSGQDLFDARSNVVTLLGQLAGQVLRGGEPLWYTGTTTDMPPQLEETLHEYVDQSHTKTLIVLPLTRPAVEKEDTPDKTDRADDERVVGALIVEQFEDDRSAEELATRINLVHSHSARALTNAVDHNSLFLMPLWRTLGRASWVVKGRTLPKTLTIAGVLLVLILAACLFPARFDLKGTGQLVPVTKGEVFVDVDGLVSEVLVQHGQVVKQGQPLVLLESTDLETQLENVRGSLNVAMTQWRTAEYRRKNEKGLSRDERNRLSGEAMQYLEEVHALQEQLRLLEQKRDTLTMVSPIDGQVVTWEIEETLLRRPVTVGQNLLSVVDPDGPWEIELYMPENRIGHIMQAYNKRDGKLQVEYITATDPSRRLEGTVRTIHAAAELHEEHGHSVRILVDIDKSSLNDPRPFAAVTAKIHCGYRPIGYVWLHELWEAVQSRVLFLF